MHSTFKLNKKTLSAVTWGILAAAGGVLIFMPGSPGVRIAKAELMLVPPQTVQLGGIVRDFSRSHSDFDITNRLEMGHFAGNIATTVDADGRPDFTSAGMNVQAQWYDKYRNTIMPNAGPGLPFGHFDVDVYDRPTSRKLYHEHEFDDKYDVTYIDVAGDSKLLFDSVIGSTYPNDLRMVFYNVHNGGGGTFTFQAGGPVQAGNTADGFTTVFSPAELTQLQINFISLDFLRSTNPKTSQRDVGDRDDSFTVRMYDVISGDMVYEVAAYHHFKHGETYDPPIENDACGALIEDTIGTFGDIGTGAITDGTTFDQWFRDEVGTNLSAAHDITLSLNDAGVYEYLTDDFFPIDDRLLGDESDAHNNNFTYSIEATFTYNACTSQFFEFEGNDDAWVFIDDKLAIDLGGVETPDKQYVALDRLDLVDGQEYSLKFFYAQRHDAGYSRFNMRTNLVLTGTGSGSVSPTFD